MTKIGFGRKDYWPSPRTENAFECCLFGIVIQRRSRRMCVDQSARFWGKLESNGGVRAAPRRRGAHWR